MAAYPRRLCACVHAYMCGPVRMPQGAWATDNRSAGRMQQPLWPLLPSSLGDNRLEGTAWVCLPQEQKWAEADCWEGCRSLVLWHPLLHGLSVTWEANSCCLLLLSPSSALLPFSPGLYSLIFSWTIRFLEPAYMLDLLLGKVVVQGWPSHGWWNCFALPAPQQQPSS